MRNLLRFSPLLALYLCLIFFRASSHLEGDEGRYLKYAENLTQGYYSTPGVIELHSGPGYPLVLSPFVFLKFPWLVLRFLNALFVFLAVLYFFSTLRLYCEEKPAFFVSYLFGLYPFFLKYIHFIYTETFTIFLMSGFLFHFCRAFARKENQGLQTFLALLYLGYLALTKVFFGYVLLIGLIGFLLLAAWRKKVGFKNAAVICGGALLVCAPYLVYTYQITGKTFYWATLGGSNFYWMTTPYEGELGDWQGGGMGHLIASGNPQLIKNHGPFFEEIQTLNHVEWDARLKARGVQNILHHPFKFFKNWICNVGRLLFNYPYSFTLQRMGTLFNVWTSMFIVVLSIFCLYPTYIARKRMPFEILVLLLFGVVSFAGSSLLAAYERQFRVLIPVFMLWITVTLTRLVKIEVVR